MKVAEELHSLPFGKGSIEFRLTRTNRRTLSITVKPDMAVTVTAPSAARIAAVISKVKKRASWIRKQQEYFSQFRPKLKPRQYVSGETTSISRKAIPVKNCSRGGRMRAVAGQIIYVAVQHKTDVAVCGHWLRNGTSVWHGIDSLEALQIA